MNPRARRASVRWTVLLILVGAGLWLQASPAAAQSGPCSPPVTNPVACENSLPGADPDSWQVFGSGDPTIQGFATSMSVNRGETVSFKIKSSTPNYKIDIFRLGHYGGDGARLIAGNLVPSNTAAQPACQTFPASGLVDCGNWSVSRSWTVPSTAVSGVYIAFLKRDDGGVDGDGGASQIPFVVRDDASTSDVVVQTSDQTWQAYNTYGGASLYTCAVCPEGNPKGYKAAFKVSYNRPLRTENDSEGSALFRGSEYAMIRFLEANGYDASYISGVDSTVRGQLIRNHRLFLSSGHDEYWTGPQRAAVEAARDAGTNLAFFSGNLMFWKTRFEPSAAGTPTADRTLVSYKDTHFDAPTDPVEWTGTWRDRRFTTAANVKPENALTGTSFLVNAGTSDITVPAALSKLRLWRNTQAASLTGTQSLRLAPGTLGYEWDVDADNGFRPAGLIRLSSTTVSGLDVFVDYGSTIASNRTATHNMTMYKAPSGARVFSAGTVQWAWGLGTWNPQGNPADRTMQQATVNLLADLGAQPRTLQSNLMAAAKTTDATAPTSTISNPPATVTDGATVTLSGTASDAGGGVVAGVEVSTDGGATWHPATGTTSWTYTWTAHGHPTTTIRTRATDDSGNTQTPGAGATVAVTCPCSIWGNGVTPSVPDAGDTSPVEVGVKFRSDVFGKVTGIRFYKASANTGTHTGSLWTEGGQRLAQATFESESASGWQTVTFAQPVEVLPNTTYVASYFAPNGHYSASQDYFYQSPSPGPNGGAITDGPPLRAVRNVGATGNGVFSYGSASSFPVNSFGAANYWVDVTFESIPAPGAVTGVSAGAGGRTSANVSWSAPAAGGRPTAYKVIPYVGSVAQPARTLTGSPPATNATITGLSTGTTYTFRVQASNPSGDGPLSAASAPVTPQNPVAPSPPRDVTVSPATSSARITWAAPESDGDSAITGYVVTPYVGTSAQAPVTLPETAFGTTVDGLTNGTAYTFKVQAVNAVAAGTAAVTSAATPQATLFDFDVPPVADSGDPDAVELGVKFRPQVSGQITGIRFYKSAANTGTHVGSLWDANRQRLAQATFTQESASGWQTALFGSPVDVTAGTTYVASYFAPSGRYAVTTRGFDRALSRPPLEAPASSDSANGVFAYGQSSTYPDGTYQAANYWVDVLFAVPRPGTVPTPTATAGRRSATVSWSAPTTGGPVSSYKVTPYIGAAAQEPRTIGGTPPATTTSVSGLTAGTAYTFTVQAINASGGGTASTPSAPVTPQASIAPDAPTDVLARPASESARVTWTEPAGDSGSDLSGYTVTPFLGSVAQTPKQVDATDTATTVTGLQNGRGYTFRVTATNSAGTSPASAPSAAVIPQDTLFDFATPGTIDGGDPSPIEVGMKFRSDVNGLVHGVRFFKAAANTGTHTGSLWSAAGSRLAEVTFTDESASGWQTARFDEPVEVTAGTTYVASYFAPAGHYSVDGGAFATSVSNPPLFALATDTSQNGVFAYGAPGRFPTSTFSAANYWVDVLFEPAPAPGEVTGVTAVAGRGSATVSWTAPASGGVPSSYEVVPYVGGAAQDAETVAGAPPSTSTTIAGLTPGTAYTFRVRARNADGSGPLSAGSNAVTPAAPVPPSAPSDVLAQPASQRALVTWKPVGGDTGSAVTGFIVTPYVGTAAQTPIEAGPTAESAVVTGLQNGTSYTFRVTAANGAGTSPPSAASAAVVPRQTIFDLATPASVDGDDPSSIEVGVKFSSTMDGEVTGLRFYKAAANTGTHVGTLWSASGERLARVTFANESATGWQTAVLDAPVGITAGTPYVASYLAPNGHYSATGAAFASGSVDNPPLRALSDSVSQNGVYQYSGGGVFPTRSFNASNYWVDVLFAPGG